MGMGSFASLRMTTLLAIILIICPLLAHASAGKPSKSASFETSAGWEKIDLRTRQIWRESIDKNRQNSKLECIIKTKVPISKDNKSILISAGFKPQAVIGTIVTGSVSVKNLPSVANLEIVEAMELAIPVGIKK